MVSFVRSPKCLESDAFRLGTSENISRGSLSNYMMLADEPAYSRCWHMTAEA